jgi:CheY-like chemotaxis protein
VDDVAINQTVIQQLLTMEGAVVTLAANGRLGVDAALAAPMEAGFDVVLMDIQMPVMDGYEATRLIRKVPHLVNLPIIAVTANVLDSDIAQCRAAGMNHHVGKPYDLDQLVGVICGAIGRSSGAPDSSPSVALTPAAPSAEIQRAKQPSQVYWVSTTAQPTEAERTALLQKGVALNVLESVEALASLRETNAPAGMLVVDQAIATSPELRALGTGRTGVSMKAMPVIALAEVATEVEMRECMLAGAVDMVPRQFALNCLNALAARYLDEQGQPRADVQRKVAAIDSQHAMQHMQSDVTFFGSLLHAFFEELPGRKKQLQDDWLHKPQQIKHHSHALKGLALTLGLHHLAELARQVENQSAPGARLEPELLAQLEGELQSAGFQILRWLQLHRDVLEVTQ